MADLSKGERTAQRILDAAEQLFADQGFEGTSLRQVAGQVGIREPGLYNHFPGKDALYEAVLARGLQPLSDAMEGLQHAGADGEALQQLPARILGLLAQRPNMAALFQRALLSAGDSPARRLMDQWLIRLLQKGQGIWGKAGAPGDKAGLLGMVALFSITTGYFAARRLVAGMGGGDVLDEDNLACQQRLLGQVVNALLRDAR